MHLTRRNPFLRACALGDLEEVERLLKTGESVDQTDIDGNTAVHIALMNRDLEMLKLLDYWQADLRHPAIRPDGPVFLPVELAIKSGFLDGLKYMVGECHVPLNGSRLGRRDNLLFHALEQPNPILMLRWLVEKGGLDPQRAAFSDGYNLMHAVEEKDMPLAVAEYLLGKGADHRIVCRAPDGEKATDSELNPGARYDGYPLAMAAWKGDPERVALYLRYGAGAQQKNRHGKDALDAARDKRNRERDERREDFTEVEALLNASIAGAPLPEIRENPFVRACALNNLDEVYARLKNGEEPDQMDCEGMAGIHIAMEAHNFELLELLMYFNADPYLHIGGDKGDLNPMELGIETGFVDGLRYLEREKGVRLEARPGRPVDELLFHAIVRPDNILTLRWLVEDQVLDPRDAIARDGLDILTESENVDRYLTYPEYLLQWKMDPNEEAPKRQHDYEMHEIDVFDSSGPRAESYGSLPLVRASYKVEPDLVELYLDYGADVFAYDRNDHNAWEAAIDKTNPNLDKNKSDTWSLRKILLEAADKAGQAAGKPAPPSPGFGPS